MQDLAKQSVLANDDRTAMPVDDLNARIGVLTRREVEARLLAPLVQALVDACGEDQVMTVLRRAIVDIARQQGTELAAQMQDDSLDAFASSLQFWTQDGALTIDMLAQDAETLAFNVIRCRYAEMYHALGIPELGALLSCNRDHALIEGFNGDVELTRTQTIMEGAAHCDFRYRQRTSTPGKPVGNPTAMSAADPSVVEPIDAETR